MKIKDRTITWQRVLGALYLLLICFITLPFLVVVTLAYLLGFVLELLLSSCRYIEVHTLEFYRYSVDKVFHWHLVWSWVKRSIDKKRKCDE